MAELERLSPRLLRTEREGKSEIAEGKREEKGKTNTGDEMDKGNKWTFAVPLRQS